MKKFVIAAIQLDSQDEKDKNLNTITEFIEEAVDKKAKIVALPENMNYIGTKFECETIPGYTTERLSWLARKHKIYIHGGAIFEDSSTQRPYDTTVMIDSEGKIIAKYRKLHMFDTRIDEVSFYRESEKKISGNEIVMADTIYGKLGFSIGYDIRFPELYRKMALSGANIIFAPANFVMNTGKDHWEPILKTRAIENTCYIVSPAQIGIKPEYLSYGNSIIVDPWGSVIAKASNKPCVITAEIDLDYLEKVRAEIPCLANRRPDVY